MLKKIKSVILYTFFIISMCVLLAPITTYQLVTNLIK
jgi:hypothetical protein